MRVSLENQRDVMPYPTGHRAAAKKDIIDSARKAIELPWF
jgi:hypothetical protein